MFTKKRISVFLVLLLAVGVLFTATGNVDAFWPFGDDDKQEEQTYVQIKGSDTIVNLAQTLAEDYMAVRATLELLFTSEIMCWQQITQLI